jgi:hypothetical protein
MQCFPYTAIKKETNQESSSLLSSSFVLLKRSSYFDRTQNYTCYVQSFYWLPIHPVSKVIKILPLLFYSGIIVDYSYSIRL